MKSLSKRELVRNPSRASHLKPGQSLELEDGKEPLVLSDRKRARLTAAQIHAELDRLCEGAPAQDAQAALRDLRHGFAQCMSGLHFKRKPYFRPLPDLISKILRRGVFWR